MSENFSPDTSATICRPQQIQARKPHSHEFLRNVLHPLKISPQNPLEILFFLPIFALDRSSLQGRPLIIEIMNRVLFFALLAWGFAACSPEPKPENNGCVVSILPLKFIVQQIVGQDLKVEVLVPSGASPETFEPTPKQFVKLNQAQFIFNVGLIDFETTLLSKIQDHTKVIDLSKGVQLIEGSCSHASTRSDHDPDSDGMHHQHGVDPHIWTSPKALMIMAQNAFAAIHKAYPDSVKYQKNFNKLMLQLEDLDERVQNKIKQSGIKYFIVYHPALTYLARDYGIQQVAIESDGKEPSARQLAEIIRNARKEGVRKIFYQKQFPESVVMTIANDIQAQYIEIDPLEEQVIDNIDHITDLMTKQ